MPLPPLRFLPFLAIGSLAAAQDAYLVDAVSQQLFAVNVTTGAASPIGSTLNHGLDFPGDLTWRATTQELWTIDTLGGELGTLDVHTGAFHPVFTASPASGWVGLAFDETTHLFYLTNGNGRVYSLDPAAGTTTLLGNIGSVVIALDTDAAGNLFGVYLAGQVVQIDKVTGAPALVTTTSSFLHGFGINRYSGAWFGAGTAAVALHHINPTTGVANQIGVLGSGVTTCDGFDFAEKPIDAYLVDSTVDKLYAVDLTTGTTTPIGSTLNNGLDIPVDLTWRAATAQLWAVDQQGGEVGTLDVQTGTFTPMYTAQPANGWQAIAWDEATQRFYLANAGHTYALDPSTGATTHLGPSGVALITALDTDGHGNLYGIDLTTGAALLIDKTTGAASAQATTLAGFQGLGIDQDTGTWYGANTTTAALYTIAPTTGIATQIGGFGPGVQNAKGFDLVDRPRAYLIDSTNDTLYTVDLGSGAATPIAATNNNGLGTPADLTWVEATHTLWTVDLFGGEVGTLDPATGTFTVAFQTLLGMQAMTWDPVNEAFYFVNQDGNSYRLNPRNGVTVLLGATTTGLVGCLDADAAGNLYGIDFFTGEVLAIDKATGAATTLSTTIAGFQGLGIDHLTGEWFAADTNDDSLHYVNPNSGNAPLIGANGGGVTFAKGFDLVDVAGQGAATQQTFGTACGGLQLAGLSRPVLGRTWDFALTLPSSATLAAVAVGFQNPARSLQPVGAPTCTQYSDALVLVFLTLPLGTPSYSLAMPTDPAHAGLPLFAQGLALVPGLNALGVGASNGLRGVLGNF